MKRFWKIGLGIRYLFLATLLLLTAFVISDKRIIHPTTSKQIEIRGIYGSPEPFWKKNLRLGDLGVNAIFIHDGSINESMMNHAKEEGLKVFAEFATLNGKNYVEEHPEAWAIDEKGEKVKPATWFMGVCPTEPGFRQHRTNELRKLCKNLTWTEYGWIICTGMPSLKIRSQFFLRPVFVNIVSQVFNQPQISTCRKEARQKKQNGFW